MSCDGVEGSRIMSKKDYFEERRNWIIEKIWYHLANLCSNFDTLKKTPEYIKNQKNHQTDLLNFLSLFIHSKFSCNHQIGNKNSNRTHVYIFGYSIFETLWLQA